MNRHVLCQLHAPGASRPRAIAVEHLDDGSELDVCAECLDQMLEARVRLGLTIKAPFPVSPREALFKFAETVRTH